MAAALEAEPRPRRTRRGRARRGRRRDGAGRRPARTATTTQPKRRRRGRRGRRAGAGAPAGPKPLEGTFDHGEEGYGLWLDPAVQDDPVYAEHWAGHRPVTVTVEPERIVITRAGEDAGDDADDDCASD